MIKLGVNTVLFKAYSLREACRAIGKADTTVSRFQPSRVCASI